jgi:hypothetical protein
VYDPNVHLFVDDEEIQCRTGCGRIIGRPAKHPANPLIVPDRPWEATIYSYGSVLRDAKTGRYRLWYLVRAPQRETHYQFQCYAESADGVQWEKPELGLYEYAGSRRNNICLSLGGLPNLDSHDGGTVLDDPADPDPNRRYKFFMFMQHARLWEERQNLALQETMGLGFATSPDGLHWQLPPTLVLPHQGDRNHCAYDDRRQRWLVTSRYHKGKYDLASGLGGGIRTVNLAESTDLLTWSELTGIIKPDDDDPPATQFYSMYPFTLGNQYLGFLEFHPTLIEKLDTRLTTSRDGRSWRRVLRQQPWLECGPEGTFEDSWVVPTSNPPIELGDQLAIYYGGRSSAHGHRYGERRTGIGLATLRKEGFVGLAAGGGLDNGGAAGFLMTERVCVGAPELFLNATCHGGEIRVEIASDDGRIVDGYEQATCQPLRGDGIRQPVRWQDRPDLRPLVGQRVRLRFWFHNATLFAYVFGHVTT